MEDEKLLAGYCRRIDRSRMVMAERVGDSWEADCNFGSCPYEAGCDIAQRIRQLSEE